MTFQNNPQAIPFGVAALISGSLAWFAWRRRGLPGALAFGTMMAGEAVWALAEALELSVADLPTKKLLYDLRIAGTLSAVLGMLTLVLHYTSQERWLVGIRFQFVIAPALVLIVLAWTDDWHHLFWAGITNEKIDDFRIALRDNGPGSYGLVAYSYTAVAVSIILLLQAIERLTGVYRAQAAIMLFGVLVPTVTDILDWTDLFAFIHGDVVSLSFVLTGLAFLPGLYRFGLLDLTPVAQALVVKGMNDPVVVIDRGGRIIDLNLAARELVGRPYAEVLGYDTARAFARWSTLTERLRGLKVDGEARFDIDGPDADKPSSFDARISRLGAGDNTVGWVLVLRDVTLQKRAAEEHVRMLREQAARTEAEAANLAKDRFLATLSHELRTPLTPVLATVTAMLADPDTPVSLRSVLEMIRRNVVLEARLIDDLLDVSRIRRGSLLFQREIVGAHPLINQVVDICRDDLVTAQLALTLELDASKHHVDADPIRFQQALWNLIKNAIKFTPAGGRVTVRSHNADATSSVSGTPELVIEISDTGIGIEPDVLPRIFDVLEQGAISSTRRFGGLGLGLSISRSIVEQHGGRLSAHSRGVGLGTTFSIEMPTARAPTESPAGDSREPAPASSVAAGTRPIRILLVDDNRDTLKYLAKLLALRGYHVQAAADMASALQAASDAEFDVLVSDIELPDGSGLELMWALRASRAIPAIALSGFGAPADIEQSRSAGFAIHLTKPVDFRRLEQAILQLAAKTQVESLVDG